MSEPITYVEAGPIGFHERGHVGRDEVIATLKRYLEHELEEMTKGLAAIEAGEVRVFHQRGIYAVKDRREVTA
jgi:hypothetical protein